MARCSIQFGGSNGAWKRHNPASAGEFPAFFFHLAVGPVLELFEEGRFDHSEADADAAFLADPHEAGFRLEEDFALGQHEADVELIPRNAAALSSRRDPCRRCSG